jgi:hypothetical protein
MPLAGFFDIREQDTRYSIFEIIFDGTFYITSNIEYRISFFRYFKKKEDDPKDLLFFSSGVHEGARTPDLRNHNPTL